MASQHIVRFVRLATITTLLLSVGTIAAQTTAPVVPPCGKFIGRYALILFDFDSDQLGAIHQRILREYLYPDITPGTSIEVLGHTDIVGLDDHNMKLTHARATNVANQIRKDVPEYHTINGIGCW